MAISNMSSAFNAPPCLEAMLKVYREKKIKPLVILLQGLNRGCVAPGVVKELLRFLLPTTLYITYTALGRLQLWCGTRGEGATHIYTCPLLVGSQAREAGMMTPQGQARDEWVAVLMWDGAVYAASKRGLLAKIALGQRGGNIEEQVRVCRTIRDMQRAAGQLWLCTEHGVVYAYSKELHRLAIAYPPPRGHGSWAWTLAVGLVPYIAHRQDMRIYTWNAELDRAVAWQLPPEVTNSQRPVDCGVLGMQHCWTPMGRSLLITMLADSYQIWDVKSLGGPGQLLRHYQLDHHAHHLSFAWDDALGDGDLRLFQYWQSGYLVSDYKLFETARGAIQRVPGGQQYLAMDANFQSYRHNGDWITIALGRFLSDFAVLLLLGSGDLGHGWAAAEGWTSQAVGCDSWDIDTAVEAEGVVKNHPPRSRSADGPHSRWECTTRTRAREEATR